MPIGIAYQLRVGSKNLNNSSRIRFISNSGSSGGPILQGAEGAHASDIGCICIRLSSFLCCGLASHVRGEAVTHRVSQDSPQSSLASAARGSVLLSISLRVSSSSLLFFFSRYQTSLQHASTYTLSFATLPAFLHTITLGWAYTLRLL